MSKKEEAEIQFSKVFREEGFKNVEALARTIWEEHYTPIIGADQVEYMLRNFQSSEAVEEQIREGMEYFLILFEAKPAGYLAFQLKNGGLFLSKIYVLADLRGKGIGSRAMDFVESVARDRGLHFLSLTVNKNNTGSIKAYERLGFLNEGPVQTDIGSGFIMDDFLMRKEL
jgi:ribosomal protein S18 acetylase RimI-like enzyme